MSTPPVLQPPPLLLSAIYVLHCTTFESNHYYAEPGELVWKQPELSINDLIWFDFIWNVLQLRVNKYYIFQGYFYATVILSGLLGLAILLLIILVIYHWRIRRQVSHSILIIIYHWRIRRQVSNSIPLIIYRWRMCRQVSHSIHLIIYHWR